MSVVADLYYNMSLITGYTEDGTKVSITDAVKGIKYVCDLGHNIIPKKGTIIIHHFSHISECECSSWNGKDNQMTEWHITWQSRFPAENREVIMVNDDEIRHRADVLYKDLVIEIQHSSISEEEISAREDFYGNMIWIVDCTKEQFVSSEVGDQKFMILGFIQAKKNIFWRRMKKQVYLEYEEGWIFEPDMTTINTGPVIRGKFITLDEFVENLLIMNLDFPNILTDKEDEWINKKYLRFDSWEPMENTIFTLGKKYFGLTYRELSEKLKRDEWYCEFMFTKVDNYDLRHLQFLRKLVLGDKTYNWWCKKCNQDKPCHHCKSNYGKELISVEKETTENCNQKSENLNSDVKINKPIPSGCLTIKNTKSGCIVCAKARNESRDLCIETDFGDTYTICRECIGDDMIYHIKSPTGKILQVANITKYDC